MALTATVTFDRIGRNHNPPPLTVATDDRQAIAEAVYRHARKFLASKGIDVDVADTTVLITAGFHVVGTGAVTFAETT